MEKADFIQLCQDNSMTGNYGLSAKILPAARQYLLDHNDEKLPVIWLETSDSGDNNIAFMNTTYPYLNQVFTDMILAIALALTLVNMTFTSTFPVADQLTGRQPE